MIDPRIQVTMVHCPRAMVDAVKRRELEALLVDTPDAPEKAAVLMLVESGVPMEQAAQQAVLVYGCYDGRAIPGLPDGKTLVTIKLPGTHVVIPEQNPALLVMFAGPESGAFEGHSIGHLHTYQIQAMVAHYDEFWRHRTRAALASQDVKQSGSRLALPDTYAGRA